jgi:chromosome segregation ATPase
MDHAANEARQREMRVDAAHDMRRAGTEAAANIIASVGVAHQGGVSVAPLKDEVAELPPWPGEPEIEIPLTASPQMLARHAANLAERLQARLADVDRRESRLNSQEAEFDSRIRNARLWIDQRETELAELEQRLTGWETDLSQRQEAAAAELERADELAQRLKELAERERDVASREVELQLALTEQQTKVDALEFETAACRTRRQELDEARQRVEHRQRELDQREAKLYVEHERASHERLALDARQSELTARESRVVAQETKLADCERRLADQAGEIEFQRAELNQACLQQEDRAKAIAADERRLEFRQREIETALERFERLGMVEQRIVEIDRQADALAMRGNYLDKAEALLAERQLTLADEQRELERQRLAFQNDVTRERRSLTAEAVETRSAVEARSKELERRDGELDARERALDEIAEQLRNDQREALETRLATEETWLQLQGVLAPAALSRSVSQLRGRLSEQFQLSADEIRRQRGELESVRQELADQFSALQAQREELERWSRLREKDVEERAARLVAREGELDAQQRHFEGETRRWQTERTEYQQEIQQLLAQLRREFSAAA